MAPIVETEVDTTATVVAVDVSAGVGILLVREAVLHDRRVAEQGALAGLPLGCADHAELRSAAAGHVVAAVSQLDHRLARVALSPTLFLAQLHEVLQGVVLGAFLAGWVELAAAEDAGFGVAFAALGVLATGVPISLHTFGFDPTTAAALGAIDPVLGCEFVVFSIPGPAEVTVEEVVHELWVDGVSRVAASRWHLLWIGKRHLEQASHAAVAELV